MKAKMLKPKSTMAAAAMLGLLAGALCGCQMVSYRSPAGETFTRSALGVNLTLSSLTVETGSNGVRRVEMRGYQNDTSQTAGIVTEAAVRAAISSAK